MCSVCGQWVCAAGTAEERTAGGPGGGGGESGRGHVVGWAGGDDQYAGRNGLFNDCEGGVGVVRDGGGGGSRGDPDENFSFVVYTHFSKTWLGDNFEE